MRLDGALARTGTRCKSTGKGGHRTWLSCFTRLGNSQGSKLKSISYKIRLSRESLQVRNDLVGAIGYWRVQIPHWLAVSMRDREEIPTPYPAATQSNNISKN